MNNNYLIIDETNKFIRNITKLSFKLNKPLSKSDRKNLNRIKRDQLKTKERSQTKCESNSTKVHNKFIPKHFNVKKIIFSILFLAYLSILIYFIINTINRYLKYEVNSVVRLINEEEMDFPVVTICNSNRIQNEDGYNYFISILNQYNRTIDQYFDYLIKRKDNNDEILNGIESMIRDTNAYLYYYKIEINKREKLLDINSILDSLFYNDNYFNPKFLNPNWIFHPIFGNCFQLNTDSKWKITKRNQGNKLKLYLKYIDYEKIRNLTGKRSNYLQKNYNYIFLSDKSSNPFKQNINGLKFYNNVNDAEVKVTKSIYNQAKKPFSNCDIVEDKNGHFDYPSNYNDRKYYEQIKQAGYEYSQSLCISFCQIDYIGNDCKFRASSIKAPNNLDNFCPDDNLFNISKSTSFYFDKLYDKYFKNEKIDKECGKMCPLDCKTKQYELSLTRSLPRNRSYHDTDYVMYVGFYFDSPSYLNYQDIPSLSFYNLVSKLGFFVFGILFVMWFLDFLKFDC